MASVKEQLSAHCDKLAFGVVAAIVVAMIAVTMTGEDKIKNSQDKIAQHLKDIDGHKKDAALLPPAEPPDPRTDIERRSSRASIPMTMLSWKIRSASLTKSGSETAEVPRITRWMLLFRTISMVSISRIPPPTWIGMVTLTAISLMTAIFIGRPSRAPSRSTT